MNIRLRRSLAIIFLFLIVLRSEAQQSNLSCSMTSVPFTQAQFSGVTETHSSTGLSSWNSCAFSGACPARVVDANHTNYAIGNVTVSGSVTIAVADAGNTYSAGDFAGFLLDGSALDLSLIGGMSITTYLDNTQQEYYAGGSLLTLSSSLLANGDEIGFYTNKPFNKIEMTIGSTVGLGSYYVYYAVLRGTGSCTTPALTCNVNTRPSFPAHGLVVDPLLTGTTGAVVLGAITDQGKAIDADSSSYAGISTTVQALGTASIAVKNVTGTYDAGTLAGFDVENTSLLNVSALGNITIRTYKDGVYREQRSGTGLVLGTTVLGNSGRQVVGFVTTLDYDEIQFVLNQPVTISLGLTKIYGAVIRKFCAGPALTCNTPVTPDQSAYPVYINGLHSGFSGVACVNCSIKGASNAIDGDATTYSVVDMTADVVSVGRLSAADATTDYPAGTFAGFDIENIALLNVNVLDNIRVATYLNGVYQQSFSGSTLLAGVPTNLLAGSGRMTIGGVATRAFDEVVLELDQTANVNLGITKVYSLVLTNFCSGTIACNSTYWLNSGSYPVYVDARQTGVTGLVCAACNVSNSQNVITPATSDYAQLSSVANIFATTSLAVKDAVSTYPAGTIAGFAIRDPNNFLEVSLLQTIRISTYRNGVLRESRIAGELLDLAAVIPLISSGTRRYNIGFRTRFSFDEIKISTTPVAGVAPVLNVYGAFVDTRYVDSLTTMVLCPKPPVARDDHALTLINTAFTGSLRTNDYDPYNTPLTYTTTPATAASHGTAVISANGAFVYTPANGFTGVDSFAYIVCNAANLCVTQWAYVTVVAPQAGGANNAPFAQNDYAETTAARPVTGNAANNDVDADGNALRYTTAQAPAHGTLVLASNGSYTYTPDSSYIGSDTARLQVCDNATPAACTSSLLIVTITPAGEATVNNRPNAHDDLLLTPAGVAGSGNVLSNDNDPDGGALTTSLIGSVPAGAGTLTLQSNGSYQFTPAASYTGSLSVKYRVCDAGAPALCDTATLSITVQPLAPIAEADHAALSAGTTYSGSLRSNDRDPQLSALTYSTTPATAPVHGTVTIAADGSYTYTPAAGYTGLDSLRYTVCNALGVCATQWAYLTVLPARTADGVNRAPVAQTDFSETLAGQAVTGNARNNDLDADGNPLTYTTAGAPAHGTLTLNTDGSYTYTPANGFTGKDTATLQVCDNASPAACTTSLLIISITADIDAAANDRPNAHDDLANTAAGTPVSGNVLRNDTDPNGDALTATRIGTIPTTSGSIVFNNDGSYLFTPAAGYTGTAVIRYRVCDAGTPSLCDTATLSIAVQPAAPVAEPDHAAVVIGMTYTGSLRINDRDPQLTALTYNTTPATAPAHGTVSIAADGSFTYTPAAGYTGIDSFRYTVCNSFNICATQWAYITVLPYRTADGVNRAPVAQNDFSETFTGVTVSGNASSNDLDGDGDILTYTTTASPTHGTLALSANGSYTYTPAPGFTGKDTAVLKVCDGATPAACTSSLLLVTVTGDADPSANDRPNAHDDLAATASGIAVTGSVARNDSDPNGDALSFSPIGAMPASAGTIMFGNDGSYRFVPTTSYTGTVSIKYRVCDAGTPSLCDTATLSITVQPQAPIAEIDNATLSAGTTYSGSLRTNDRDPQLSALTYSTTPATAPVHGTVTIAADGSYTYTPAAGYTGIDSLRYTVCNALGVCATQWAYLTVLPARTADGVNRAPVAQTDFSETFAGQPVTGNARNNDLDADGNPLAYRTAGAPAHGTLTLNNDGSYTHTPANGFTGKDTATLQVCDNASPAACTTSLLIISVTADIDATANDRPNAHDDLANTAAGTPVSGNVLRNDTDPNGDALTATRIGTIPTTSGSIVFNNDGSYLFTPTAGFTGNVLVRYRVCDAGTPSLCDTATLSIAVQPAAPVAEPDHAAVVIGMTYTGSLRINDRDPQLTALTYNTTPATAPAHGTANIAADGTFTYTPAAGFTGIDSLRYTVCNAAGICTMQWAYITVLPYRADNGVNLAPDAQNDFSETFVNVPVGGNAAGNDLDANGNSLGYTVSSAPAHGTLALNANGSYVYTPANGFAGKDTAVLRVCDHASPAACTSSLLVIMVSRDADASANDRPDAHDDLAGTAAGSGIEGNVALNDSDPNGDALTVSQIGSLPAATGNITLNNDGTYSFLPADNFTGTAIITYRVCDAGTPSLCDTATLSIVVQPAAPRAGADHVGTYVGLPYSGSLRANDRDPQQSALTYNTTPATAPTHGTASIAADGSFTYTPAAGFKGLDSLRYTVCNAYGLCVNQWAYITVVEGRTYGGLNYAPVAQPDFNQTTPGATVTGNASSNDVDADGDVLSYTVLNGPTHGSLTLNTDGTYSYTADASFEGTDTALLQVCDDAGPAACVTSRLYIKVIAATIANNAPIAADDLFATPKATNLSGYVLRNDTDPDGDALTATLIDPVPSGAGSIAFAANGGFTFVPTASFVGTVSMRYRICDNGNPSRCDTATLTIVVQQVIGPDFTPVMMFDSTTFTKPNTPRDFYVRITELQNSASTGAVMFRILKPSAFNITYAAGTTICNVAGGTAVSNGDWTFTETALVITATLKPGAVVSGSGVSRIGFTVERRPSIAAGTVQSITTSIATGTGGDSNSANNQTSIKVTAQ